MSRDTLSSTHPRGGSVASGRRDLTAVGGVHIQQYTVQDYRVIPTIRPLFLFNFIGGTVLGIYFLVPARPRAGRVRLLIDALCALAGWFVAGGALLALLINEHTPLFGFMEHGYRFAIVFAIASEAVAVVTLTIVLFLDRREARRNRTPRRHGPLTVFAPRIRARSDRRDGAIASGGAIAPPTAGARWGDARRLESGERPG